jgi:hypothetical protein
MKAAGHPIVVRVDHPVSEDLAIWIAAYMFWTGEPLTVGRLRDHARAAYQDEGNMLEVDVPEWCHTHWPDVDEPEAYDFVRADLWLRKIAAGGAA